MDQQLWRSLPTKPGVYIFKNEENKIIYVGKAKDLRKRVYSYFSGKDLETKTMMMVKEIRSLSHIVVDSEIEAFLLEASLIKKNKPYYNIKLADDKFFPYIKIGKTPFPYVVITRKFDDQDANYFGPYTSTTDLKIVLKLLRRIFPYQSLKNHPKKKCLYYHLGLCPCIPVFREKLTEYKRNIRKLEKFLEGDKENLIKDLLKEQREDVKNEEFEKAAEVQKQMERISAITNEHYDPFAYQQNTDFYYQRIKNELVSLEEILKKYGIETGYLKRIECYDISNIQGTNATGSMVVFVDGDASKKDYRRFKIKFKKTPDDFAMHQEVMSRRVKRDDWEKPNLIIVDGGKGQVSSVLQVLAHYGYNVPLVGIAKREETIVIPIKTGLGLDFIEVKLPKSTPGINLVRRIRDEAHRFAITYHRLLRKKALNI
ncbi:MAG TPA: excinuclease ABC subunit UvrC [Patescibacteria group bacterium]|nr:excinuclease ABC subunit UvrC [Patescibacteria group bacterium]